MTVYELLTAYKPILRAMDLNGYQMHNIRDVEVYEEYTALSAQDGKKEYHIAVLADKYGLSRSTVYRILKKMRKQAKL